MSTSSKLMARSTSDEPQEGQRWSEAGSDAAKPSAAPIRIYGTPSHNTGHGPLALTSIRILQQNSLSIRILIPGTLTADWLGLALQKRSIRRNRSD